MFSPLELRVFFSPFFCFFPPPHSALLARPARLKAASDIHVPSGHVATSSPSQQAQAVAGSPNCLGLLGARRRVDLSAACGVTRLARSQLQRCWVPRQSIRVRLNLFGGTPSLCDTACATTSLERHHGAVFVGCIQHGWRLSTRASTLGARRRQARTERPTSWARSTHRIVTRRPVRVKPSDGLLSARRRHKRPDGLFGLLEAHSRASLARNCHIESLPLAIFQLIPR